MKRERTLKTKRNKKSRSKQKSTSKVLLSLPEISGLEKFQGSLVQLERKSAFFNCFLAKSDVALLVPRQCHVRLPNILNFFYLKIYLFIFKIIF